MKENQVHAAFSKWLDAEGIPYLHSRTDKRTSMTLGDPDYFCLLAGRVLAIEIKVGINKLSPAQEKRIAYLKRAKNAVIVARSLEDAIAAVQSHFGLVNAIQGHPGRENGHSGKVLSGSQEIGLTNEHGSQVPVESALQSEGNVSPAQNFYIVRWDDIPWLAKYGPDPDRPGFTREFGIRRATTSDLINYKPHR